MKTGLFLFGFLFLINPELITLDLFPDLIGFLLIARALEKGSHLEERLSLARRWAFLLAISSAAKLFANLIVIPSQFESTRLTASFVFFVLDLWLSYMFADNLLKGVQYLATRLGSEGALKGFEVVRGFLISFFIVKHACHFLPQGLAALYPHIDSDADHVENFSEMVSNFQFTRSILFIACIVVLLVFGIYTFRVLSAYSRRLKGDTVFCENVHAEYLEKVGENENVRIRIAVRSAFFRFFVGSIFLFDFYSEGLSLLPQPVFGLFTFWGLSALKEICPLRPAEGVLRHVGLWGTVIPFVYRVVCLFVMDPFETVFPLFVLTPVMAVLSQLASLVLFLLAMLSTYRVAREYTAQDVRLKLILLSVAAAVLLGEGTFAYIGILSPIFLAIAVWIFYALILYFYKDTADALRAEIEYKYM